MSELEKMLEGMEEAPLSEFPFPIPPIEEVISQAALNVKKVRLEDGSTMTMLHFITPFKIYTFRMNDEACAGLSDAIRPSGILRANVADLRSLSS